MLSVLYSIIPRIEHIDETVSLTISESTPDDEGDYTVKAVNEKGVASCSAEVLVHIEAPIITQPLSDAITKVKDTARFECRISGLPQPTVTWFVDQTEIHDGPKYTISRRNNVCVLEVKDVVPADADVTYTCKANNVAGEASTTASLHAQGLLNVVVVAVVGLCMTSVAFTQCLTQCLTQSVVELLCMKLNHSVNNTHSPDLDICMYT